MFKVEILKWKCQVETQNTIFEAESWDLTFEAWNLCLKIIFRVDYSFKGLLGSFSNVLYGKKV